jgi:hypothetical protein
MPCCKECNHIAFNHYPFHFWDRAAYVKSMMLVRYSPQVKWDNEEIDGLGFGMRMEVLKWQRRRALHHLISVWSARNYLSELDLPRSSVTRLADLDITIEYGKKPTCSIRPGIEPYPGAIITVIRDEEN